MAAASSAAQSGSTGSSRALSGTASVPRRCRRARSSDRAASVTAAKPKVLAVPVRLCTLRCSSARVWRSVAALFRTAHSSPISAMRAGSLWKNRSASRFTVWSMVAFRGSSAVAVSGRRAWCAVQMARTSSVSRIGSNGFGITPMAPMRSRAATSSGCILAVMKMAGTSRPVAVSRNRPSNVGPSMPGIITSSRSRSGRKPERRASASSPDSQARTVRPPTTSSASRATSRMSGSSSTYRTRSSGVELIARVPRFGPARAWPRESGRRRWCRCAPGFRFRWW